MSQVKISFKAEEKLATLTSFNIQELQNQIHTLFSIPPTVAVKIRFLDSDFDLITISLEEELQEAIQSSPSPLSIIVEAEGFNPSSQDSFILVDENNSSQTTATAAPTKVLTNEQTTEQTNEQTTEQTTETTASNEENLEDSSPVKLNHETSKSSQMEAGENDLQLEVQPAPDTMDLIANEFHYHRLIVQTAVQSSFQQIREKGKPVFDEAIQSIKEQKAIIMEAITTTLREWRNGFRSSPSASDIANKVSDVLKEAGMLAKPVIDNIRQSIINILNSILENKNPLTITDAEVEQMSEIAAQAGNIEMENFMADIERRDSTTLKVGKDVQVPSTLEDEGFVCVENYRQEDPTAEKKENLAAQASELVWELPAEEKEEMEKEEERSMEVQVEEPFEFQKEYDHLVEMGFDGSKIKDALNQHHGDVDAAINQLV